MITSKKDLIEYIDSDNTWFSLDNVRSTLIARFARYTAYELKKYLIFLRKQEYYINTANGSKFKGLMGLIYERKKNKLGNKLGIEIHPNCFEKGLQIYHGNIIVNSAVRVGQNCKLHGNNCIGNNGLNDSVPMLGNNIDIGFGSIIIGEIIIADNIIIGASSLVNHSFS